MPLIIIIVGLILRSIAPWLFYLLGIAFLAFLIYTACIEIKNGGYGWKEGIASGIYLILILWLMLT